MEGNKIQRGLIFNFEGGDGCGKSTQCTLLSEYFNAKKIPHICLRFPDRKSATGSILNKYLKGNSTVTIDKESLHMLFSINRREKIEEIKYAILSGYHVIIDRYVGSGQVYSLSVGLDLNWIKFSDKGNIKPDIVFLMDVSPMESLKRIKESNNSLEVYENVDFQNKIKENYNIIKDDTWITINASLNIDEIQKQIQNIVVNKINNNDNNNDNDIQYY